MKKKFNLYKTLKIIFLSLAILTMLVSLFGRGKAEDFQTSDLRSFYISQLDPNGITSYDFDSFFDFDNYPYTFMLKSDDNNVAIFMFKYNDYCLKSMSNGTLGQSNTWQTYMFGGSNDNDQLAFKGTMGTGVIGRMITHQNNYNGSLIYACNYNTSSSVTFNGSYNWTTGTSSSFGDGFSYYQSLFNQYVIRVLGSGDICSIYIPENTNIHYTKYSTYISGSSYVGQITYDMPNVYSISLVPPYDSAFEIYKTYGVGGINDPILHVGYTEPLSSQGFPYNSYTSYTLTFDVDGTSVLVTVSSDGVYADYFVDTSTNLPMEFIYRMLQNQMLNFSDANSVRLTNVSMSATFYPTTDFTVGTPETYTKSTLCDLVLKGGIDNEYDSDNINEITSIQTDFKSILTNNAYTNTNIVSVDDLVANEGIEYPLEMLPSWASNAVLLMTQADNFDATIYPSTWNDLVNYSRYVITKNYRDSYHLYYQPSSVTPNYTGNVGEDIIDNMQFYSSADLYSIVYDYIDRWVDSYLLVVYMGNGRFDYYMIYTDRYFNKLTINGISNVQQATQSVGYYTKGIYDYLYSRLNNMSDNMASFFGGSLSNQTVSNGILSSINTNVINIQDYVNGISGKMTLHNSDMNQKLTSILSAINNLSFDVGDVEIGLTSADIARDMTTSLNTLFMPTYDSIEDNFDDYKDSLGILALPFDYANGLYGSIKNSYSNTMELDIPSASYRDNNGDEHVVMNGFHWTFDPKSLFNEDENILSIFYSLQYFNAFLAILLASWLTYCHIFRRDETRDI